MQREISSWVSFLFLLSAFPYKASGKMGPNKCKGWADQGQVDQLSSPAANGQSKESVIQEATVLGFQMFVRYHLIFPKFTFSIH